MYPEDLFDVITDCKHICRDLALADPKVIFTDYQPEIDELKRLIAEYNELSSKEVEEEEKGKIHRLIPKRKKKTGPKVIPVGTAKYPPTAYYISTPGCLDAVPYTNQSTDVRKSLEYAETLAMITNRKGMSDWLKIMGPVMIFGAVAIAIVYIVVGSGGGGGGIV